MATGVDFVCFPYPREYAGTSDNPKRIFLSADTIVEYAKPTQDGKPVVARVGYSFDKREYVCIISYYNWPSIIDKDDTNTCAFTDPAYGKGEPFSALSETFVGQSVYVTIGRDGAGGKRDTGLKVSNVHGAVANLLIYFDGNLESTEQASIRSKTNGSILTYGGKKYAMGLSNAEYSVSLPVRTNCTLVSVEGNVGSRSGDVWVFDATEDLSLVCRFSSNYTVAFDSNGGSGVMSSQAFVSGVGQTLTRNAYANGKFVFAGWNTAADGSGKAYADGGEGSGILADVGGSAGAQVTLYAQWRKPTVYITNSDAGRGTLKLYRAPVASANLVATESDGVLAADAANGVYIVVCEQKDPLYRGKGLGASEADIDYLATTDSEGKNTTRFELQGTLVELLFYYARRKTYRVDFAYSPTGAGTALIQKRTDGVWPSEASVASEPDEIVDGVPRWLPQTLRFIITPAAGYDCRSLHVVDSVDGTSSQPSVTNPPAVYVCDLTGMDDDVRVDLVFERQKFDVSVGVDAASASVGVATVESTAANASASGIPSVEYGSEVTFRASLKEGVSAADYRFEGWYVDDIRIGTDAVLTRTVTEAVSVVAKFAARIRLGLVFTDNRSQTSDPIAESAALTVNGAAADGGVYDGFTVLGGSLVWSVAPGSMGAELGNWNFNAWYVADDTAFATPLEYGRSGSLDVSESVNMVARLMAVKISSTLVVKVHVNNPATDVAPDLADPVVASTVAAEVRDGGYAFKIDGSGLLSVTAKPSITIGGKAYSFNGYATGIPGSADYQILSSSITYTRFLNEPTRTIWALYGEPKDVTVTLAYGGGGNRTMGILSIDGETNEESGGATVTKTVRQGDTVSIAATARNGYRFVGWYFGGSTSGEPDGLKSPTTVYVTREMTVLALFVRDARAVYEWEGSGVNKMMEWKSKVYVSPRPFNPSALRVDTEGYPVGEVRIGMFSSPDGGETAVASVRNVASQDVRRLPKRRPERYLQVTVKNDHEVDRILVGTSMEGLAV